MFQTIYPTGGIAPNQSDCQVRVRCDWCIYVTVVTCADILTHLPYVFSSFCCLMNYYTVTFATC